jgi:hypothetical protein
MTGLGCSATLPLVSTTPTVRVAAGRDERDRYDVFVISRVVS